MWPNEVKVNFISQHDNSSVKPEVSVVVTILVLLLLMLPLVAVAVRQHFRYSPMYTD